MGFQDQLPCVLLKSPKVSSIMFFFLFEGQIAFHDPLEGVLELLVRCCIAERVDRTGERELRAAIDNSIIMIIVIIIIKTG